MLIESRERFTNKIIFWKIQVIIKGNGLIAIDFT